MYTLGNCVEQIQKSTALHFIGHIFQGQKVRGHKVRGSEPVPVRGVTTTLTPPAPTRPTTSCPHPYHSTPAPPPHAPHSSHPHNNLPAATEPHLHPRQTSSPLPPLHPGHAPPPPRAAPLPLPRRLLPVLLVVDTTSYLPPPSYPHLLSYLHGLILHIFFSPDHHGLVMENNFAFMKLLLSSDWF